MAPDHVLGNSGLGDFNASFNSSPWIRGAPHSQLARLISRIRWRISLEIAGRPPLERDFQCQYARKPFRCQRITVAGLIIATALRTHGHSRYSKTKTKRSHPVRRGRRPDCRRKTLT
jgi:hypothetical protein